MQIPPVPAQDAYLTYLREHQLGREANTEAVERFVGALASPASHDELEALAAATRDAGTLAWLRMRPLSADAEENSALAVIAAVHDA